MVELYRNTRVRRRVVGWDQRWREILSKDLNKKLSLFQARWMLVRRPAKEKNPSKHQAKRKLFIWDQERRKLPREDLNGLGGS